MTLHDKGWNIFVLHVFENFDVDFYAFLKAENFDPKEVIGEKKPLIVTPLVIKLLRIISTSSNPSFKGSIKLLIYIM